jgi:hypothetical protein
MPLAGNTVRDIEIYVAEQLAAPVQFPAFTVANKPLGSRWRFKAIYITDTSKPAWMDSSGTWRYADGSAV